MLASVLAMLLQSGGTPGGELRWWIITTEPEKVFFVDAVSIRETDRANVLDFWFKSVSRKEKDGISSLLHHTQIDCYTHEYVDLQFIGYDAAGKVSDEYTTPVGSPKAIPPDTILESVMLFVCTDPKKWVEIDVTPTERRPESVTEDIYRLMEFGVSAEHAELMASMYAPTKLDLIERMIDRFVPPEHRETVRGLYGIKPTRPSL